MLNPPQNRRMGQPDTAFPHHRYKVAIAQFVAEIPANAQHLYLLIKVRRLNSSSIGTNLSIDLSSQTHSDAFAPEPYREP
jgi:hypothetical protein